MDNLKFAAPVDIQAAAGDGQRPSFVIAAYTGGAMKANFNLPVVVDLSGLQASSQELPVLLDHDPSRIVGQTSNVTINKDGVQVAGIVTADDGDAGKVLSHSRNGFKWKSSIGAQVTRKEFLEAGRTATVNGRTVQGPLMIARAATLREVSLVSIAADDNTSVNLAATFNKDKGQMDFDSWLQANIGNDGASLTDGQRTNLKAAYEASQRPSQDTDLEGVLEAKRVDRERVSKIANLTASALSDYPNRSAEIESLSRLAASAGWTTDRYELEMLRAMRTAQTQPWGSRDEAPGSEVLECAFARTVGVDIEKHYDEKTLEAAHQKYRHGLSLKEVTLLAARAKGYRDVTTSNIKSMLKAAFNEDILQASGPYSTLSLPTVFSNIANKTAIDAFNYVANDWEKISAVGSASDFKEVTSVALTGDLTFERIPATGQIKHGSIGETTYGNKVNNYGRLLGLSYEDYKNDDAGALATVMKRLGRGAALALNTEFWSVFQDNATFFTAARGNFDDGTDSAFGADGLTAADLLFRSMVDPDGNVMGTLPKILVVPPALRIAALRLLRSQQVYADSEEGGSNPWAGAFDLVSSAYLTSAKAYYLLADPNDIPVIETRFLDGQRVPTIEACDPTPDYLGVIFQAHYAFGCRKQEYRGGVKMKGEA